ncbi:HEPN domain-containing protein [Candidatus Micrarchaeota archaeon]|nr:HEPN domain-containing protein [Candidatus Micrarchaeota archaeon]
MSKSGLKAEKDIKAAVYLLDGGFLEGAAFHAQQAAEKALKYAYIRKTGKLKKVHDLVFLAKEVGLDGALAEKCSKIDPFYAESRYPGFGGDFSREDVENAVQTANEVIKWARTKA